MFELRHYLSADGRDVFALWRSKLKDKQAKIAIDRRLYRLELGNIGDHKPCRAGVWELRIDSGPGYRVYYARSGQTIILLLCGGDKSTQEADISRACAYWQDWQQRQERS